MRKALYFEDAAEFSEFVRLGGAAAKPARGRATFELCRVINPEKPGNSALVLFDFRGKIKPQLGGPGAPIEAEIDPDGKTLRWNLEAGGGAAPLMEKLTGRSLLEFVELQPWKEDGSNGTRGGKPRSDGPVLFWIRDPDPDPDSDPVLAESLLARLVQDSLQLGNDRIQFGSLESDGQTAAVLRIESPSFFLIQQCLEDFAGQIDLFYPADEDLFVRWGFLHPLADWWRNSEPVRSGAWLFFPGGSEYRHIDPVVWRDAYDLADIELDFPHRESWTASADTPPNFRIPLTLERRLSADEPELWLLNEVGVRQLERTLQITDQESLRAWQIAVQRSAAAAENDSPAARDWVFLRETRTGNRRRRHHDFAGTGFARYRGMNNLLLPVGHDLQPPLRRDAYRDLFDLEPGVLTLLYANDSDESEGGYEILRIREKAFDALSSFVDYIVERDATRLESLLSTSVFDFRHYLKAPKRPDLFPETGDRSDGNVSPAGIEAGPTPVDESAPAEPAPEIEPEIESAEDPETIDESRLDTWHREELRLERELLAEGQSLDRWCELLTCKNELAKNADATLCAIEASWLAAGTGNEEALRLSLASFADATLGSGQNPADIAASDSEWMRRAAVFSLVSRRPHGRENLDRWVGEMTAFLSEHDAGLRSKERWLAWGAVLSANLDIRREARIREEIQNAISERGLSLEETPAFLRSRVFLDRKTDSSPSGPGEKSQSSADTAIANLGDLRSAGFPFKNPRLRLSAQAILARSYANLGDLACAENMLEGGASESERRKDPCGHSWENLFQIEALRQMDVTRAEALDRQYESQIGNTDEHTASALREMRETCRQRADADDPAAFLARQNRARTYPSGAGTESGILYELSMQLEAEAADNNEAGAARVMREMMRIGDDAESDDSVKLPQFVETLVAGLERFKWGERGAGLIPIFESFSDRAAGFLKTAPDPFYLSILHSNLALGLLSVENLEKAVGQLELAFEGIGRIDTELDFVDAAASVIRTIEQLPLGRRSPFLCRLVREFAEKFDGGESPFVGTPRLFAVVVRLLDQMAEAASSKDRLSLEQFRQYQLQDEFLILQRIQSESFCEPPSHPVNPDKSG